MWECLIRGFLFVFVFFLPVSVCASVTQAAVLHSMPLNCLKAKNKKKDSLGENDNDSEASGAPHESAYSHKSPGFITLHTGCRSLREVHLISRNFATV